MARNSSPIRSAGTVCAALLAALLRFAPAGARAADFEACAPSAEVKAALDGIPSYNYGDQPYSQYSERKIASLRALRSRFPGNLFVERAYVESLGRTASRDGLIEEYKALHDRQPDDPLLAYLYGLTLYGLRTPEAITLFDAALDKAPLSPWPHLTLSEVYVAPRFSSREKSAAHLKAYLDRCPGNLDGYGEIEVLDDPVAIRQGTERFRRLLETRRDPEALAAYPTLWGLEFQTRPGTERDRLRRQVAADLKRIRSLGLKDRSEWYAALTQGYQLLGNQKEIDRTLKEGSRRFPRPWDTTAEEVWDRSHPAPTPETPPGEKRAYYSALLKASDDWVKSFPRNVYLLETRLEAMAHLDDVPAADVTATVDRLVALTENNAGPSGASRWIYFDTAKALSQKAIEPERVVALARKGLDRLEFDLSRPVGDLSLPERVQENAFDNDMERFDGNAVVVEGYLALRQPEQARGELARLDQRLRRLDSLAGDKDDFKRSCARERSSYWWLAARLAEIENRKIDAMAFYGNALLARFDTREIPERDVPDRLADGARRLWSELGGTEAGWQESYGRREAELEGASRLTWVSSRDPLPAFELVDLGGRTWRSADLKGKVTLLNVWATW